MEDFQVVAAIVAGDPAGLAEAYDRYAMPLYAYCRSMLPDPADAADAVQDTFLVAAAELRHLVDSSKLRPWLYAVARNECLRRLRTPVPSTLDEALDVPDENPDDDPELRAERIELRALVRGAIDGLNPRDRDIVELSLVHELSDGDLVDVLGVPRNHAFALLSRARSQLEKSLGALLVARSGRGACADLDALLDGWDGKLTVLVRKRLNRHIEHCGICGPRKASELRLALLAGVAPAGVLLPAFREQLLQMLGDHSSAGLAHRLGAAHRAGPFTHSGFPKAAGPPAVPLHSAVRHAPIVLAGTATSVIVAGVVVIGVGPHPAAPAATLPPQSSVSVSAAPLPSATQSSAGRPSPSGPSPSSVPSSSGLPASPGTSSAPGTAGPSTEPTASPTVTDPMTDPMTDPAATPSDPDPAASATPSADPVTSTTTAAAVAPAAATPAATPAQGTLSIAANPLDLLALNVTPTGHLTLTAEGGPVSDYTVTAGFTLVGGVTIAPATGSLAQGQSVTITVTANSLLTLNTTVTVNPGGRQVLVTLTL